jgi:hypothetical protein
MPEIERRRFGRREHFKSAFILRGTQRAPAMVYDVSERGVSLRTAFVASVDDHFELAVPEDDVLVRCRVAWVQGDNIGAEFLKSPQRLSWNASRPATHNAAVAMLRNARR